MGSLGLVDMCSEPTRKVRHDSHGNSLHNGKHVTTSPLAQDAVSNRVTSPIREHKSVTSPLVTPPTGRHSPVKQVSPGVKNNVSLEHKNTNGKVKYTEDQRHSAPRATPESFDSSLSPSSTHSNNSPQIHGTHRPPHINGSPHIHSTHRLPNSPQIHHHHSQHVIDRKMYNSGVHHGQLVQHNGLNGSSNEDVRNVKKAVNGHRATGVGDTNSLGRVRRTLPEPPTTALDLSQHYHNSPHHVTQPLHHSPHHYPPQQPPHITPPTRVNHSDSTAAIDRTDDKYYRTVRQAKKEKPPEYSFSQNQVYLQESCV